MNNNTLPLQAHRNSQDISEAIRGVGAAVVLLAAMIGGSMMAKASMPRPEPEQDVRWTPNNFHIYNGMPLDLWETLHAPPVYWKYHARREMIACINSPNNNGTS